MTGEIGTQRPPFVDARNDMRFLRGSARGARVGGGIWAVGLLLLAAYSAVAGFGGARIVVDGSFVDDTVGLPLLLGLAFGAVCAAAYFAIRPWFLGVFLADGLIVCRNWIRTYSFDVHEVTGIRLDSATTAFTGIGSRFILFVGRIRTIEIRERNGDQERAISLTCTLGRFKTVQAVADEMRAHAHIRPLLPDG
ncbi:hypothetical protein [Microbacterium capsulatum]|uniref:DUF304 domain-containing protein n=1 Tax=Microbacterium capsulatum TaxID=3041921 RepID=A0ABU0XKG1_9MICO|nr:hypothetical protein [Microbacterium sp. ASV81]MDQ4215639.1 hypothetical protein [Microbacterium sp. ASV81]